MTLPRDITYGEKYGPAMKLTTQESADAYLEQLVEHAMGFGKTREAAEQLERSNLGYWAGYYGAETRERVERLFKCEHPVFGSIAKNGQPTIADAFAKGRRWAEERSKA